MVKEMRVPSSSSSNSKSIISDLFPNENTIVLRTNGDWLNSDTFLEVCVRRVIGILSLEDFLSA